MFYGMNPYALAIAGVLILVGALLLRSSIEDTELATTTKQCLLVGGKMEETAEGEVICTKQPKEQP